MKFRKKPVVIEAVQWNGNNLEQVSDLALEPSTSEVIRHFGGDDYLYIDTLEGTMRADKGDWIIKGVKGEIYPCKPDIFEATYEPAESAQASNKD